jgi:hypothetical protein
MATPNGVTGYRIAAYDTPFWVSPNRTPGRYHVPGRRPTQYLCGHPAGPWAELLRATDERDPNAVTQMKTRLWAARIPEPILEITFDTAGTFDLTADDLVSDDWAACQRLAEVVATDATLPGVLSVPSAALPGTVTYVLLGPRVAIPFDAVPIDDEDVAAAHLAEDARPLAALQANVRFRGMAHAGLTAWNSGRPLPPIDIRP